MKAKANKRRILRRLGNLYSKAGKGELAIEKLQLALGYSRNELGEAEILNDIGEVHQSRSEYKEALRYFKKSLEKLKNAPKTIERVNACKGMSWVYYLIGEYDSALRLAQKALNEVTGKPRKRPEVSRGEGVEVERARARIYSITASIYSKLGESRASFDYYQKAMKIYEKINDMAGLSAVLNNLTGYYSERGDMFKAIDCLIKALEIDKRTGNALGEAIVTYNLGEEYYKLNDLEKALSYYKVYQSINKRIHNRLGDGWAQEGLGRFYQRRGEFERAKEAFEQAIAIFEEVGSETKKHSAMAHLSDLLVETGLLKEAEDIVKKVEEFSKSRGEKWLTAYNCIIKGKIALRHNNPGVARRFFEKNLKFETEGGYILSLPEIHYNIGKTYENEGNLKDAEHHFKISRTMLKEISTKIPDKELQERFLKKPEYQLLLKS